MSETDKQESSPDEPKTDESRTAESTKYNPFSQPWEDSDLVVVVEDEKFHVHRPILTFNSSVFKAMLKSEFKPEGASGEITLSEKNANEILDLLKQLYPQEREDITIDNVEYFLKLADEYQIKIILDRCATCLRNEPKTESNAMKILLLAQRHRLNYSCEDCHNQLAKLKLQQLEEYEGFTELNGENVRSILLPRMRRLEEVVKELSPQVAGMVACTTWLWNEAKKGMTWCPSHIPDGRPIASIRDCLRTCPVCKRVIESLVNSTSQSTRNIYGGPLYRTYFYTSSEYNRFDSKILSTLQKLFDLAD